MKPSIYHDYITQWCVSPRQASSDAIGAVLRGLGKFLQGLEELLHLSHLFLISSGHSQHGAVGDLDL